VSAIGAAFAYLVKCELGGLDVVRSAGSLWVGRRDGQPPPRAAVDELGRHGETLYRMMTDEPGFITRPGNA
jgi:hypothetical protein